MQEREEDEEWRELEEVERIPLMIESAETIIEERKKKGSDEDRHLREDLERLQILQSEMAGESDSEIEKYKCRLIEEMPLTKSQEEAVLHFKDTHSKTESGTVDVRSDIVEEEEEEEEEDKVTLSYYS